MVKTLGLRKKAETDVFKFQLSVSIFDEINKRAWLSKIFTVCCLTRWGSLHHLLSEVAF